MLGIFIGILVGILIGTFVGYWSGLLAGTYWEAGLTGRISTTNVGSI